jgi:hypothetical protein
MKWVTFLGNLHLTTSKTGGAPGRRRLLAKDYYLS